ncbi:MAG: stage II sporulation protein M [Planctomycetota bacterium]
MDLNQFLHERRPRWKRLEALLDRVDRQTVGGLSAAEAEELFALYRFVSSDLNLVQTRTGNPALLEYLEGLVARAYANLAVPKRGRFFRGWWVILRHRFPAVVRREWRLLALATAIMLAGALLGFTATLAAPYAADVLIPPRFRGTESPRERVERLEGLEREGDTQVETAGQHAVFSSYLFTHNIRVSVLAFALGFTFGLGTVVVLFYNGAILGAVTALYLADGVFTFFVAWVGPHGSLELPCVCLAGLAGLMLARALFRRDDGSFRSQLRGMRPDLVNVLVGAATLLVVAGIIEGGFSQVNEPTLPYWLKIAVAAALFAGLVGYLFVIPVRPDAASSAGRGARATLTASAAS